jgi:predicted RNase H-like HicB family nuclease
VTDTVTSTDRYPAEVFWSDEDEAFIAVAPDLPGCSAVGDTQQEALTQLHDAISAWIEAARTAGNPIPGPSRPASDEAYSGKLLVRMPRTLHGRLARQAKSENVSLNQYIVYLLVFADAANRAVSPVAATSNTLTVTASPMSRWTASGYMVEAPTGARSLSTGAAIMAGVQRRVDWHRELLVYGLQTTRRTTVVDVDVEPQESLIPVWHVGR